MKRYIFRNLIAFTLVLLGGKADANFDDAYSSGAYPTVRFFYAANESKLVCNGVEKPNETKDIPTACDFDDQGLLDITRTNWHQQHALLKSTPDGVISITGSCRDSVTKDNNLPNAYQLALACIPDEGAVTFYWNTNKGKISLTCNKGEPLLNGKATCRFNDQGQIELTLTGWGGPTAILNRTENGDSVTGFCRNTVSPDPNNKNSYQVAGNCIPVRVNATGQQLVDEWLSDLPWHQKLSTKHSNQIDIPFVLPYAAIPPGLDKNKPLDPARYMLRYGIVNVMAMHRTDTLYRPGETPEYPFLDCADGDCVEMKFEFQRLNTQTDKDDPGYSADTVTNNSYVLGPDDVIPSLGFAITESTIFAPWRPWYVGHYCAVATDNIGDSVCYEDYFTTQLLAKTPPGQVWLRDFPALFEPQTSDQYGQWCVKGSVKCPMFLGKVEFRPDLTEPEILKCQPPQCENWRKEVKARTKNLDDQFNTSLGKYVDIGRFPWLEEPVTQPDAAIPRNPFIGYYPLTFDSKDGTKPYYSLFKASPYVLPKKCTMEDFYKARSTGDPGAIQRLKACSTNFEVHTNGFFEQWQNLYGGKLNDADIREIDAVLNHSLRANQYGRTMFMYAGLPEQKIAASFAVDRLDGVKKGVLPIHDKLYGASLYTQYLPMVNPDDQTLNTKYYEDEFWHTIFMSDHMNQEPGHFIRGIRGRTLWHNEYRSFQMYQSYITKKDEGTKFKGNLDPVNFPAGFQRKNATSPFHGNTCDSCHIRNGSGVPLMPNGKLPPIHLTAEHSMKADFKLHPDTLDYTYTNQDLEAATSRDRPKTVIPSMKLVFFEIGGKTGPLEVCDANNHTIPKSSTDRFYNNKLMNFYGNSLHVNLKSNLPSYDMQHVAITPSSGFLVVDQTPRKPATGQQYVPKKLKIENISTSSSAFKRCTKIKALPDGADPATWPTNCTEVEDKALQRAIDSGQIGYMQLLGKRLGNTPLIEMISNQRIKLNQTRQKGTNGITGITHAGCYGLVPGTRVGTSNKLNYRSCKNQKLGIGANDCYISRWGWIGDRASLEDQIANAAHVEMNISSIQSYERIHPGATDQNQLVRYNKTLCGPADAGCQASSPNSDITEQEIRDMATYQRWIGIPERSEYQVSSEKVQRGEVIFRNLGCGGCHVTDKIRFIAGDNMLPDEERAALKKLQSAADPNYPFVSYLGTDLLLHDMGYLSQVAKAPVGIDIRNPEGTIKTDYRSYVQYIRTPPLKGLQFNRFITDSNHNSTVPINKETADTNPGSIKPGCDFLLHDGRACDVIEAAYLHDGPAVKALRMIERLNGLSQDKLDQLRAFLYSL